MGGDGVVGGGGSGCDCFCCGLWKKGGVKKKMRKEGEGMKKVLGREGKREEEERW